MAALSRPQRRQVGRSMGSYPLFIQHEYFIQPGEQLFGKPWIFALLLSDFALDLSDGDGAEVEVC